MATTMTACSVILVGIFAQCFVGLQASDASIRSSGMNMMSLWAKEATDGAHTSRQWQRRAEAILSMVSGLEGKEAPEIVINTTKTIIDLLDGTIGDLKDMCEADKVRYAEKKEKLFNSVKAVPPSIEGVKDGMVLYSTCMEKEEKCWQNFTDSQCGGAHTSTTGTTTATPCSAPKPIQKWSIPHAAKQKFVCDFSKMTAEQCADKLLNPDVGLYPDKLSFLNETYNQYQDDVEACKTLSAAQNNKVQARKKWSQECSDLETKCIEIATECGSLRSTGTAELCALQQKTKTKCEQKDSFLATRPTNGTHPEIRRSDYVRHQSWKGLTLVNCMLKKFVQHKMFHQSFKAECDTTVTERNYEIEICGTDNLDWYAKTADELTDEVEVPATCPSVGLPLLTFDTFVYSEDAPGAPWFNYTKSSTEVTSNATGWLFDGADSLCSA